MNGNLGLVTTKGVYVFVHPREGKSLIQKAEVSLREDEFVRGRESEHFCLSARYVQQRETFARLTRNAIVDHDRNDIVFRSEC